MTMYVREILGMKNDSTVWCIESDRPVYEAIRLLSEKGIGALVVRTNGVVSGIMTERDYARKVILKERSSKKTLVSEIMNERVWYVTPDDTAECSMALMSEERIRHLPVLENGVLCGIISMGDLVKSLVSDREFLIDQLLNYITGSSNVNEKKVYKDNLSDIPHRQLDCTLVHR